MGAVTGTFCGVQVNSVLTSLLITFTHTHNAPQNYEEDIKRNFKRRASHNIKNSRLSLRS